MTDNKRLIEVDFPLEQVSLDFSARKECPSWAHLYAAHLAGTPTLGSQPCSPRRHATARPWQR